MPVNIALYQPEIPPNTGNIMRLCANVGATLHLIQPLGFELNDKKMKRAGLDYLEHTTVELHQNYDGFLNSAAPTRIFAYTTKGSRPHSDPDFLEGDYLLFGPETRGLPDTILKSIPADNRIRIPMVWNSRSLNLANAVAIATLEAWRQLDYVGSA
tara:strand:+ start:3225 stop:3692 length:468 start_codon:yes stop_codon:yes gene_type:complete